MGLKPEMIDEFGGTSRALIEVPLPLPEKVARWIGVVFLTLAAATLIGVILYYKIIEPFSQPLLAVWLCILILGTLAFLRGKLVQIWESQPDFAIEKHGILLRAGRDERFYEWDEVIYCHWSHFEPGVLNIQVGASPEMSPALVPPTRLFYRVPEPYRSGVEKAIRAMGKWAEGESPHAPVRAALPGNDPASVKPATFDELDGTPTPLVEIPCSIGQVVATWFQTLLFVGYAAFVLESASRTMTHRWFTVIMVGIVATFSAAMAFYRARHPAFAVYKDGISLPTQRNRAWSSQGSLRALGLFAWEEVSYCRWSRYKPGLLQVQVKPTRSDDKRNEPPMRLVYPVPEPYRSEVEKAIRAMGKWAD